MPTVTIRQLTPEEAPEVMYPLTSYPLQPFAAAARQGRVHRIGPTPPWDLVRRSVRG